MNMNHLTDNEYLRAQLGEARTELRRLHVAEAVARMDRLKAEQAAADASAKAASEKVAAEELERHRGSAWLNYRSMQAQAKGDEAFRALLSKRNMLDDMPATGWPPGDCAENYRIEGIPQPKSVGDAPDLTGTLLGQVFAKRGAKL